MSNDTRYNGWTNYETWCVDLWLGNDQGSYEYWREQAQECWDEAAPDTYRTREEDAAYTLAERLKDDIAQGDGLPDLGCSMYADLLNAALSEVNWDEIANHYISEVDKEEEADT